MRTLLGSLAALQAEDQSGARAEHYANTNGHKGIEKLLKEANMVFELVD